MLPACAFWEVDGWDDHPNAPVDDAGLEAGLDGGADAPPAFCRHTDARVLVCEGFDEESPDWLETKTCSTCDASIGPTDAGNAPSRPNVLFVSSRSEDGAAVSIANVKSFDADLQSVTSDFWFYVDTATSNGVPAIQDLQYQADVENYIRVRVTLAAGDLSVDFVVAYVEDRALKVTFPFQTKTPVQPGVWHRVHYTIRSNDGPPRYTWRVDDELVNGSDDALIPNGEKVAGKFTHVELITGIEYVGGYQPDAGKTAVRVDSVLLTTP